MIETKDLEKFLRGNVNYNYPNKIDIEYMEEIVARLRAYDKLKESIEKLIATISSEVDK